MSIFIMLSKAIYDVYQSCHVYLDLVFISIYISVYSVFLFPGTGVQHFAFYKLIIELKWWFHPIIRDVLGF